MAAHMSAGFSGLDGRSPSHCGKRSPKHIRSGHFRSRNQALPGGSESNAAVGSSRDRTAMAAEHHTFNRTRPWPGRLAQGVHRNTRSSIQKVCSTQSAMCGWRDPPAHGIRKSWAASDARPRHSFARDEGRLPMWKAARRDTHPAPHAESVAARRRFLAERQRAFTDRSRDARCGPCPGTPRFAGPARGSRRWHPSP